MRSGFEPITPDPRPLAEIKATVERMRQSDPWLYERWLELFREAEASGMGKGDAARISYARAQWLRANVPLEERLALGDPAANEEQWRVDRAAWLARHRHVPKVAQRRAA